MLSNNNDNQFWLVILIQSIMKSFIPKALPKDLKFPFLNHDSLPLVKAYCFMGYEPHYKLYEQYSKQIFPDNCQVYCLDKEKIDLALEMSLRRKKTLTIISDSQYSTVSLVPKQNQFPQQSDFIEKTFQGEDSLPPSPLTKIDQKIKTVALHLLVNYKFLIKSSYLDVHPLEAYKKMCGYLLMQPNKQIKKMFKPSKFTDQTLRENTLLVPFLSAMRDKFLVTEKLKLKILDRRQDVEVTDTMRQDYFEEWKKLSNFRLIQSGTSNFDEKTKLEWAINNNIGSIATLQQIALNNKYRHHHFATWY